MAHPEPDEMALLRWIRPVLIGRAAMAEASRVVLDGFELGTDAEIIRWPDRYADPRGLVMWATVMSLMEEKLCAVA